jgi:nitrogen fixation NifU-like protein
MSNSGELMNLYRERILEHARNPRNFGKLANATHVAEGINPLCGDKLKVYLRVNDDVIEAVQFEGTGCAVAMASASMLTATMQSCECSVALTCANAVTGRLTDTSSQPEAAHGDVPDELRALDGVREFPARVKCATLAWHTLRSAINKDAEAVTTE